MDEPSKTTQATNGTRRRSSFSVKLAGWMLLVAVLPLLLYSAIAMTLTSRALRLTITEEVTALRNFSLIEAKRLLEQQQDVMALLSLAAAGRLDPQSRQEALVAVQKRYPDFVWLGIFDRHGRLVSSAGGGGGGPPVDQPFVQASLKGPTVSDARKDPDNPALPVYYYGMPVTNQGRSLGSLVAMINLSQLNAFLHQGRIRGSGETYLVRRDGTMISESRFGPDPPLSRQIDSKGFQEAADGRWGTAMYEDYRGVPVVGSFAPFPVAPSVPGSPHWMLLSEVDQAEALAPVNDLARAIALLTLLMLGLIGLAVQIVSRQVTEPLRRLEASADGISHGNWVERVHDGFQDEFGQLAAAFNRMAEQVEHTISELQQANEALEAAERRFRLVADNAPVILLTISPGGIVTFAEGRSLAPYADPERGWIGRSFPEAFQAFPALVASLERAMRGAITQDEVALGPSVFQVWYAVAQGEHGPEACLIGVAMDVTERKKLEASLAETQRIAHLGSWSWDFEADRLTWSEETYRIYGLMPDQFAGTREALFAHIHPDDRALLKGHLDRAIREGRSYQADFRIIRADGEIRHLHSYGNVRFDARQKPTCVFGTVQDVTERKRIEEAQTRTLTLLQAQQEATLDGFLVVDEHRAIIGYNSRFLALWNIPARMVQEVDDRALLDYVLTQLKDPQGFLAHAEAMYEHPMQSARDELELADGRVFDRYTAPVVSAQGELFGRIWSFRDLTERRRLEDTLREQYAKLQELDQLKNDFVNSMSHDLRIPLTAILGYAEFLEDEFSAPLSDQQLQYVAQIQRSTQRLARMVNDLLDFARLEAGSFNLVLEDVDLAQNLMAVTESMRPQIEDAGLRLEVDVPSDLPPIRGDADRLERVMANLLSNAIKFTPAGGLIRVSARVEGPCSIVEVADTGEGIAQQDIPRLFKRFSQLEQGKRRKGGTGLGLSISKAIVDAHDGSIGVRSRLGVGSTFWFSLPLASGAETESP